MINFHNKIKQSFLLLFLMAGLLVCVTCEKKFAVESSLDPSTTHICKWYMNKQAAFTFSFDDVRESHYLVAAPLLEQYGFRGTFFLDTGHVKKWAPWQKLANAGHEIGSHTVTHPLVDKLNYSDLNYEFEQSKRDIEDHIQDSHRFRSFAYPYWDHSSSSDNVVRNIYFSARAIIGINMGNCDIKLNLLKGVGYWPPYDADNYTRKLKETIAMNGWMILVAHSLSSTEKNETTGDYGAFSKLAAKVFLQRDQLWVATQREIAEYIYARCHTRIEHDEKNDSYRLVPELDDVLDSDVELTVKLRSKHDWSVIQFNDDVTVIQESHIEKYVILNIPVGREVDINLR